MLDSLSLSLSLSLKKKKKKKINKKNANKKHQKNNICREVTPRSKYYGYDIKTSNDVAPVFGKSGVPLHCYYSQVHSDTE